MSETKEEATLKICPFSGKICIGAECTLWSQVGIMKPGSFTPLLQGICAFTALCLLVAPRPQPQHIPPRGFNLQ